MIEITPAIRRKQVALGRALRDRDDALAEQLATELAPLFDEIAEEVDKNPKAVVPCWGTLV